LLPAFYACSFNINNPDSENKVTIHQQKKEEEEEEQKKRLGKGSKRVTKRSDTLNFE